MKTKMTLSIDSTIAEIAKLRINNISAYVEECLRREINAQSPPRSRLSYIDKLTPEEKSEALKIAQYNWIDED